MRHRARSDHRATGPLTPLCAVYFSVVTVTGDRSRTVIGSPARSVAVLRSLASTAAAPAPAPAIPPIAAPLPPPRIAPRIVPATAAAAHFRGGRIALALARTFDRRRGDRQSRAVRENDRLEPDRELRLLLELAAAVDLRDVADGAGAGGNGDAIADLDVARHAGFNAIFDARTLARHRRVALQADHGVGRDHQLLVSFLWGRRPAAAAPVRVQPSPCVPAPVRAPASPPATTQSGPRSSATCG